MLKLEASKKKVSEFLLKEINENFINELKAKEFDLTRVYVKGIVIERWKRVKRIDYKGRGRSGVRKWDFSSFCLEFYEESQEGFIFKLLKNNSNKSMIRYLL